MPALVPIRDVSEDEYVIPVPKLIGDHLDRHAADRPNQAFMVQDGRRLTYAEAKQQVDDTAAALIAAGIEPGDRVSYLGNPTIEFWVSFLAISGIGAIWLGLNPKYTSGEIDHVVGDAAPRLIFSFAEIDGEPQHAEFDRLRAAHPSIEDIVTLSTDGNDAFASWRSTVGPAASRDELAARRDAVASLDPAFLVYTSGSTGRPKGALITHRGSNVCNSIAVERKHLSDRTIICNLPVNHVGAIGDICGRVMTGGGTIHFQERFSPEAMLTTIEAEQLNTVGGVPTMLQLCVDHPRFAETDLSSIELIAWGGAAMPAELLQQLLDKTGAPYCTMGYGMTEVTGGVTYSGLTDSVDLLAETIGTPDSRQAIRIWHPDGRLAEAGEAGEIQAWGDYLMAGYWQNPEATAAAFTDDGWFHTGDLAVWRDDGFLQIVGRMSEMFKSGGYNVYPREVELALEEHPDVSMAAVVKVSDPTFQEVGVAYVMGTSSLDPVALRSFAGERLANYKVPKRIEVLDELPMLPIGKVDKKQLEARAASADDT